MITKFFAAFVLLAFVVAPGKVAAQPRTSVNYRIVADAFDSGGGSISSPNYRALTSIGEMGEPASASGISALDAFIGQVSGIFGTLSPPSNNGLWSDEYVELRNTAEAELMVRVGDIDNLGYGWPGFYDPFSGKITEGAHDFPWVTPPGEPEGTDRIMVVSSYNGVTPAGTTPDGYTTHSSRPANTVRPVTLNYSLEGITVTNAVLQVFLDDVQSEIEEAQYQVEINGIRAPFFERLLKDVDEGGPNGQLITIGLPPEFLPEVAKGRLSLKIDDPTTGAGDGYAIDFVKLLMNTKKFSAVGTIQGTVTDWELNPLKGVQITAAGIVSTYTDAQGHYTLRNVPAGLLNIDAVAPGYLEQWALLDLEPDANENTDMTMALKPVADLAVKMSAAPTPASTSADLVYTIQVSNQGPEDAQHVVLTNVLPPEVVFKSATLSRGSLLSSGPTVVADLGYIAVDDSAQVRIVTRPQKSGVAVASAFLSSEAVDPVASNNSASIETTIVAANSGLILSAPVLKAGVFQCLMQTEVGKVYDLQMTEDLKSWQTIDSITATTTLSKLADPTAGSGLMRFYRVVTK